MQLVSELKEIWGTTTGEDRKLLAHSLFDELIYDLDGKRIGDFKIKSWAEPFLVLRAALYEDQMGEEMKNRFNSSFLSEGTFVDPNGSRTPTATIGRNCRVATRCWRHSTLTRSA